MCILGMGRVATAIIIMMFNNSSNSVWLGHTCKVLSSSGCLLAHMKRIEYNW